MQGITWLASYPKSGSTWLRFICFHLWHGRSPHDSRELDLMINSRLPTETGRQVVKTHAKASALETFFDATARAIYIHRHPLDVLASALNYAVLTGAAPAQILEKNAARDAWIADFLEVGGYRPWLDAPFMAGTWSENVTSWRSTDLPFPVLTLSYEDLSADPLVSIRTIGEFLGLEPTPSELAACVEATSFAALRSFEDAELKAAERAGAPQGRFSGPERQEAARLGLRFFNDGRPKAYRDALSQSQVETAVGAFGEEGERLYFENAQASDPRPFPDQVEST